MENDELMDLASMIGLKGEARDFSEDPLTLEEVLQLKYFCQTQLCDGDLHLGYKTFYQSVYNILSKESEKALN